MAKKEIKLSWDDFQNMGNPQNAPEMQDDNSENTSDKSTQIIRIRRDKKLRGGKVATVIEGLEESDEELKTMAKLLKTKCGVGGNAKNGIIILQGDHRTKLIEIFKKWGYSNTKLSGG